MIDGHTFGTQEEPDQSEDVAASSLDVPGFNNDKLLAEHALEPTEGIFASDGKVCVAAGRGVGLRFAATYFPEAKSDLRIASSYFTIAGYDLGRHFIDKDTKVYVLVGQKQGKAATNAVVSEMKIAMREIMRELGTTRFPLTDAVETLVTRIKEGKFIFRSAGEIPTTAGEGWQRFHCKFYIADDLVVWTGSANFTKNGMSRFGNEEQLRASRSAAEINYFLHYYNEQLESATDLLAELLAMLDKWLGMHHPFEAYLKALLCTYTDEQYAVENPAKEQTYFQEGVIVRGVEQVRLYHGALLLVATGLGKTIIGAEIARRVQASYSGSNVKRLVVIAPRATERSWRDELSGRGCSPDDFFDNSVLFVAPQEDDNRQANRLDRYIEQCNANTVFLIDEAHRYRNLLLKTAQTTHKNRKLKAEEQKGNCLSGRVDQIAKQGGKIILLTATPFGTQIQNINSLLRMLPPTSPSTKKVMPKDLFDQDDLLKATVHWKVTQVDKTAQSKVVTILGMLNVLHMARDRGDVEPDGRLFLAYKDGSRRYLPTKIRFHRVAFPLFLQAQMEQAIKAKAFDGEVTAYFRWNEEMGDAEPGATNSWLNNTLRAWLSSPRELKRVLQVCYDTPDPIPGSKPSATIPLPFDFLESEPETVEPPIGNVRCRVKFTLPQLKRQNEIKPLLALVDSIPDAKLTILSSILKTHRDAGKKIIIFVKRHATAVYLESEIGSRFGRTACTVQSVKDTQECKLRSPSMRQKLVRCFAPNANTPEGRKRPPERDQKDILICTDADGIGQNMQDATVVVNYDLALTADELFQRAGRVLRPTPPVARDREIDIYTFVPDTEDAQSDSATAVNEIVSSLFNRQNEANGVSDGGRILPAQDDDNPVVMSLACAEDLDNIPTRFQALEDRLQQEASSVSRHVSNWEKNKDEALRLSETNVMSAKTAKVRQHSVCMFIKGRHRVHHVFFNLKTNRIENFTVQDILDLLECTPNTERATISVKQVEAAAIKAFEAWLELQSEADRLFTNERVCVVYLHPETSQEPEEAVGKMLNE